MGEVLREELDYPHCLKKWLRLKVVVNELGSCSKDQKKEIGKSETRRSGIETY